MWFCYMLQWHDLAICILCFKHFLVGEEGFSSHRWKLGYCRAAANVDSTRRFFCAALKPKVCTSALKLWCELQHMYTAKYDSYSIVMRNVIGKGGGIVIYPTTRITGLLFTIPVNVPGSCYFCCFCGCLVASAGKKDRSIISQICHGLACYTKVQFKNFETMGVIKLWIGLN